MRVLIAGCGYVGTELGLRLRRLGAEVWGLRRDPSSLPSEITPFAADLLAPGLAGRIPDVDHVVYAASSDGSSPDAYQAIYVDGVRNLLAALADPGRGRAPDRFVFVSSTAVYGDAEGGWVDEESETEPESFRGRLMLEGEALALGAAGIVLRLGGIYGPGRTRLLDAVREGRAACPGGEPLWSNRIHRDDVASALLHLLTHPEPARLYLGVDDEPTPICEVYRTLARMLDAPEPEVDPETRRDRANKRCSNRRLRGSGLDLEFPSFREGYAAMIEPGDAAS